MPLRPTTVASVDDIILAAVLLLFILLGFNARHVARIFTNFFSDIWSVRQRDNIFEEHTATETQTMFILTLLTSVLEGVILYNYFGAGMEMAVLAGFGICIAIALAFNIFSIVACTTVGYAFTSPALTSQWRRGLYASQAMLGLFLLIPTIILLVRPNAVAAGFYIGATLYVIARLLYIIKGIRIFYDHFYSWLYFILYLCTLEIIPLLVIWRTLGDLCFPD